jgi:hypothetical protein
MADVLLELGLDRIGLGGGQDVLGARADAGDQRGQHLGTADVLVVDEIGLVDRAAEGRRPAVLQPDQIATRAASRLLRGNWLG